MKSSLKDIADSLQLSKTTVSWVLSGKGDEKGISFSTQEKVFECAKKMNYRPNLLARSLNTGLSGTIGLILPDIGDSFYSQIAREVEMEAEKYGYSLMICSSESEKEREERMIRVFRARQVDGIIIAPTKQSKKEILQMIDDLYPFVIFDRYFPELRTNYIVIDNEESSYKLVRHLIEGGYHKIALITTNPHLKTMSMRCNGYSKALVDANIPVDFSLYGEVNFENYQNDISDVLDKIIKDVPDVDAFFFTTHILALEAFLYFHQKEIHINEGYGLACIHEVSSFKVLAPRINTARMPIEDIGREAVLMLINNIERKQKNVKLEEPQSKILFCELTFRD